MSGLAPFLTRGPDGRLSITWTQPVAESYQVSSELIQGWVDRENALLDQISVLKAQLPGFRTPGSTRPAMPGSLRKFVETDTGVWYQWGDAGWCPYEPTDEELAALEQSERR